MSGRNEGSYEITADVVLKAYACGIFPMAESADDPGLFWVEPDWRGVLPLDDFHCPKRLARTVRQDVYDVSTDRDFAGVIAGCAAPAPGRRKTWISERIRRLYSELFERGHCHTIEVRADGQLVGGLYGVSIGSAFFGESMFSRRTDASKVALVHLVARLRAGGYTLLDTQFITEHLRQFGAIEIPREDYSGLLERAVSGVADFGALPPSVPGADALQFAGAG